MAVKVLVVIFLMGFSYVASATYSTVGYNSVDLESEENLRKLYSTWVAKHGLVRKSPSEQRNRYRIFKRNLNYIEQHNKRSRDSSTDSYWLGLNHFADMTREEFTSTYSNSKIATITEHKATNFSHVDLHRDRLPLVVDWRQRGAVTGVKNQGKSAHGWAFSSTAAVEGINKIMRRSLISLSEQELLDCVSCSSDCVAQAFQLIIDNGGIDTEDSYPYTGSQAVCNQELLNRRVVSIDGYEYVPQKNEAELKRSASQQPVSVWIEISNNDLQFYSGGIFIGKCGSNIDHAVLVVGYGSRNGRPYWLIKNSWGSTWGEKGYMRIERNVKSPSGKCGIAMMPSYPVQKIARCGSRTLCPS